MIHWTTHNLFLKYAKPGMDIIELGDQLMDIGEDTQFMRSDDYYAERKGLVIQSIDIHGKNRALPIDLSKAGKKTFKADLLTDFGTCEHVSDLYNALKNCHNFTKDYGLMIHANPKTGTYPGHGVSFFTQEFWAELAEVNGYELVSVIEKGPYSDDNPDKEVICVLKKGEGPFCIREIFEELAMDKVFSE